MAVSSPAYAVPSLDGVHEFNDSGVGKGRSCRKAVEHGLTGQGIALVSEDEGLVAHRVAAWSDVLGAVGDLDAALVPHPGSVEPAPAAARDDDALSPRNEARSGELSGVCVEVQPAPAFAPAGADGDDPRPESWSLEGPEAGSPMPSDGSAPAFPPGPRRRSGRWRRVCETKLEVAHCQRVAFQASVIPTTPREGWPAGEAWAAWSAVGAVAAGGVGVASRLRRRRAGGAWIGGGDGLVSGPRPWHANRSGTTPGRRWTFHRAPRMPQGGRGGRGSRGVEVRRSRCRPAARGWGPCGPPA